MLKSLFPLYYNSLTTFRDTKTGNMSIVYPTSRANECCDRLQHPATLHRMDGFMMEGLFLREYVVMELD